MFHVEIRMGMQVVREFNLDERALWVRYLAPLLEGREFTHEGHDWEPRKTRITILDGPELRPDQLAIGRGWPNARRLSSDVTATALARARELHAGARQTTSTPSPSPPAASVLRERLIGRLGAGPIRADQIRDIAVGLMPESDAAERQAACEQVVWDLLAGGEAQLAASER